MALLEVGRIVRPHALRGEVVVELVTNRLERLDSGAVLEAATKGAPESTATKLGVVRSRPFGSRFLVSFAGCDTREDAELLRDWVLRCEAAVDPEELFVHDLIGSVLVDQHGVAHGAVIAVEANPASDLLVLEGGGLVPLRFVVSHEDGRIVAEVPDGLFE